MGRLIKAKGLGQLNTADHKQAQASKGRPMGKQSATLNPEC
ncbi:hypothetical protein [Vibrio agarilyticus]|nr:hypothetical protein [Vibrio agarilyticus]